MSPLIPLPVSVVRAEGAFALTEKSRILVDPGNNELAVAGHQLAEVLRPATGHALPVVCFRSARLPGDLLLTVGRGNVTLGDEGYELNVTPEYARIAAPRPAGVFWGAQTLRQLLPPAVERPERQPRPWVIPAVAVRDRPRFQWRGFMLDVARHFFGVGEIKRVIDLLAAYKMNVLHLHLTDDQGWRIEIRSWPRLAEAGGSSAVGGGDGGFYSQAEYAEIVAYAQARHVTVVPEIEMPGHTGAALASYAELNADGVARPPYTCTEVGHSSLALDKEITYRFVEDVIREIAELTPGPYLHIGGDETWSTDPAAYVPFVERVQAIVHAHGKQVVGWEEIAQARLLRSTVAQHWLSGLASQAAAQGAKVILSPAARTYLDMKYDTSTPFGLEWAGHLDVQDAYSWEPATQLEGVSESDILGVEAPLWTETVCTHADLEVMALPRLLGIAEIGWSQAAGRDWEEYRLRLAAHGPRMEAMGRQFYRSPAVPWE